MAKGKLAKEVAESRSGSRVTVQDLLDQTVQIDPDDAEVAAFLARWGDRYSERNLLLLYVQRSDATELHTYKGWLAEGRQVRKGEKAIRMLAPKGLNDDAGDGFQEEATVRVRPISLFDVSQTDVVENETSAS